MVPRLGWHFDVLLLFAAGYNDYTLVGALVGSESVNSDFTMEHKWRILWRTRRTRVFFRACPRAESVTVRNPVIFPRAWQHMFLAGPLEPRPEALVVLSLA